MGIEKGLRHAWELGYRTLVCVSDCKLTIDILKSDVDVSTYWALYTIRRICTMLSWDWRVTLQHIPREENLVVGCLAKQASRDDTPLRIWRLPPSFVVPLLCQEDLV